MIVGSDGAYANRKTQDLLAKNGIVVTWSWCTAHRLQLAIKHSTQSYSGIFLSLSLGTRVTLLPPSHLGWTRIC